MSTDGLQVNHPLPSLPLFCFHALTSSEEVVPVIEGWFWSEARLLSLPPSANILNLEAWFDLPSCSRCWC
jgi:hypothetical protein